MPRYWGQIDVARATQDYFPFGGCVRLVAVDDGAYTQAQFNQPQGCPTYFIDLGFADLMACLESFDGFDPTRFRNNHSGLLDYLGQLPPHLWMRIDYAVSHATSTYAYEIFTGNEPTYLAVHSVALQAGASVVPALPPPKPPTLKTYPNWKLVAFHVGQGMCSLLTEDAGQERCLLDAGAGTPVRRHAYMTGALLNELVASYGATTYPNLPAFISHPDSDHWRLLDWDKALFANVSGIYLPDRTPSLAFKSTHAIGKTWSIGSTSLTLDATGTCVLDLRRSQPYRSDRNGECLVSIVSLGQDMALLPGDYVYDRMAMDGDTNIRRVAAIAWAAIVVPHHGDSASANQVPAAAIPHVSKAFFSAGTHAGYGHPTATSISAHKPHFDVIDRHTLADIKECQLLP